MFLFSASFAQTTSARLPMTFEPNQGQAASDVHYLLHAGMLSGEFLRGGVSLWLPASDNRVSHVQMQFLNPSRNTKIEGEEKLSSHTNYLVGRDPSHWLRSVPNYGKVIYRGVYPGTDVVFYDNGRELEHDFELKPGADPGRIGFRMEGARKVILAPDGGLLIEIAGGEMRFMRPIAYQTAGGTRRTVDARFRLSRDGTVHFHLGRFDASRALVIDPALDYATYLDTLSDIVSAVATDSSGNTYITGLTFNSSFPVTANAFQTQCADCANLEPSVFITKLNATGTAQVYSTFLGGNNYSQPTGIAVDANGNAVVTGWTEATDFPAKNPVSSTTNNNGDEYAFISSLSADGSALNYSSVMGGGTTGSAAVAVDSQGAAYITGGTDSSAFPITPGALKALTPAYPEDAIFVTKFTAAGALAYSAIVGDATSSASGVRLGSSSIAIDSEGSAYITGGAGALWPTTAGAYATQSATPGYSSVFVTKIAPDGSAISYSTLVGVGAANSIALDSNNNVYIAGASDAASFPTTEGAYETQATFCCMFFSKMSPDGSKLLYSSFFGGTTLSAYNNLQTIKLDNNGNIWLAGATGDRSFPLVNPLVGQMPPAGATSFLSEFDSTGTNLEFSTYIGDSGNAGLQIALDPAGKVHGAGITGTSISTTPGAFLSSVTAPPQDVQYTYPYAEVIDPTAGGATLCLTGSESNGLSFGDLIPGTSTTQTITIQSCGSVALTIQSISSNNAAFSVPSGTNSCTGTLAVGSSCTVSVQFEPSAAQSYTGTLTINSNASVASTTIPLNGAGAEPVAAFAPAGESISTVFQPLLVGQTSPVAYVQLFNNSPVPLTINLSQNTISGDFAFASGGTCTTTLPANGRCFFAVTFTPTAAGTREGFLSVSSNDPVNPILSEILSGTAYSSYPIPMITALLNPSYPINSGTSPISISIEGSGFFPASVVNVNGVAQTTTYNNSNWLSFTLDPSVLNAMGSLPVTVQNPTPGGGTSTPYSLIAYISVPLTASALTVDPVGGLLYATIPSSATQNPNTVVPINPSTGVLGTPEAVATNPQAVAVSDDGTELYVASTGVLQRFNLKTMMLEKSFNLPVDPMWGQTYVQEMHVVPGSPQSIAVELFANVDPAEDGLALFNDSGLVNWLQGVNARPYPLGVDSFAFLSASTIYAQFGSDAGSGFATVQVSASGLSYGGADADWAPPASGTMVRSDGTLLYTNGGQVWNPSTQTLVGTYLETGTGNPIFYAPSVIPETSSGHTYFLDESAQYADYQAANIDVYSQASYALLGTVPFLNIYPPDIADLVRWGTNGFAFRSVDITGSQPSANQIVIVTSSLITNSSVAAPVPTITSVSPTQVYSGDAAFTLQVNGIGFTKTSSVEVNGTPLSTTYVSSSSLSAQVPASDLYDWGQLTVQVVTGAPGGGISNEAYVDISPGIALSTSSLEFGNLTVGAASAVQTEALINDTTSPLSITSVSASGDFTETNNCGSSVAANSSCTISVILKPSTTGMITGTLTVLDNAPSATQTASLLGFGLAPYSVATANGGSLSAAVAAGSTATYNLQVSGRAAFSGSVNLSCSGAPQYATCSISPSSLTLASGGSGTFTVSVSTGTTTMATLTKRSRFELAGFGLLAILLLPLLPLRKRMKELWLASIVLAATCFCSVVIGCGGGGGGNSGSKTQTYTTPPGTYTLTITASNNSVSSTQTLTLIVN
jgi:hypothetical protein